MRTIIMLVLLLGAAVNLPVLAADETPSPPDSQSATDNAVLESLFEVLDQETTIATKTKMNKDHVPGMVTVLHGADALRRGARNVHEAMNLLPGVSTTIQQDGMLLVVARGVGNEFASGKIKVLLNGAPFNNALNGFTTVYSLPLEQVDRIEFNHGPGSMVYGEYAFAGVLNVITRKGEKSVALATDSSDGGLINTSFFRTWMNGKLSLDLNLAASNTEGPKVDSGEDRLYGTPAEGISNAPGPTNEENKVRSGVVGIAYGDVQLVMQHVYSAFGDHFGLNNMLPEGGDGVKRKLTMQSAELTVPFNLGVEHNLGLTLGMRNFVLASEKIQLAPRGFRGQYLSEGMLGGPHYEETERYLDLHGQHQFGRNELTWGLEKHKVTQGDTWVKRNYDPLTLNETTYQVYRGSENWIAEGMRREVLSAWTQDQVNFSDKFYVAAGIRLDNYKGQESVWSPRLATVYKPGGGHIIKFQASQAYRPPTFLEQNVQNNVVVTGNQDLEAEHVTNYELGYILRRGTLSARATAYVSYLDELVQQDSATGKFANDASVEISGLEAQAGIHPSRKWQVDVGYSLINVLTGDGNDELQGVPEYLLDVAVGYIPVAKQQLTLAWAVTGKRPREEADPRPALKAFSTVDLTWSSGALAGTGVDLIVSLRNIFDEEIKEPAGMGTYQDDYPRQGRNWWIGLSIGG